MIFKYEKPIYSEDKKKSITESLKDLYSFYLPPAKQKTYDLIERYWKALPYKLIRKYNTLHKEGKTAGAQRFKDLVYKENPFLTMVPKESQQCQGVYMIVPLSDKDETNN